MVENPATPESDSPYIVEEAKKKSSTSWLKTKKGKVVTISAAGLALLGTTAIAAVAGSQVSKNQTNFSGPDHKSGGPLGYSPKFGSPDGDHPFGDRKRDHGPDKNGPFDPNHAPDGDHGPDDNDGPDDGFQPAT